MTFLKFVVKSLPEGESLKAKLDSNNVRLSNSFFVDENIFNPYNMMPGFTNLELYDERVGEVMDQINYIKLEL